MLDYLLKSKYLNVLFDINLNSNSKFEILKVVIARYMIFSIFLKIFFKTFIEMYFEVGNVSKILNTQEVFKF